MNLDLSFCKWTPLQLRHKSAAKYSKPRGLASPAHTFGNRNLVYFIKSIKTLYMFFPIHGPAQCPKMLISMGYHRDIEKIRFHCPKICSVIRTHPPSGWSNVRTSKHNVSYIQASGAEQGNSPMYTWSVRYHILVNTSAEQSISSQLICLPKPDFLCEVCVTGCHIRVLYVGSIAVCLRRSTNFTRKHAGENLDCARRRSYIQ